MENRNWAEKERKGTGWLFVGQLSQGVSVCFVSFLGQRRLVSEGRQERASELEGSEKVRGFSRIRKKVRQTEVGRASGKGSQYSPCLRMVERMKKKKGVMRDAWR